jgi:gluconokinase
MDVRVIVVMGVSGCGKSTLGAALAVELGAVFLDADDFHPPENVTKMRAGVPLTDEDRSGWLRALRDELDRREALGERVVLACSALKQRYRDALGLQAPNKQTIYLEISRHAAEQRLQGRAGHFMPASLVASQFDALEVPTHAISVDATLPPATLVRELLAKLVSLSAETLPPS